MSVKQCHGKCSLKSLKFRHYFHKYISFEKWKNIDSTCSVIIVYYSFNSTFSSTWKININAFKSWLLHIFSVFFFYHSVPLYSSFSLITQCAHMEWFIAIHWIPLKKVFRELKMFNVIWGHLRIQIVLLISCYFCFIDSSPDRPAAGCSCLVTQWGRLCLKWLLVSLMLSKQSGTAPPWLQSQDRPSLDYQAGKRLTADCLDTSVSSEAQGIAREVLSVWDCVRLCVCVWEERWIAAVSLPPVRVLQSLWVCMGSVANTLHSRWMCNTDCSDLSEQI